LLLALAVSLDIGAQDGIDARLIPLALLFEPVKNVGVYSQINPLFISRHAQLGAGPESSVGLRNIGEVDPFTGLF
jgi:hypothetical protein